MNALSGRIALNNPLRMTRTQEPLALNKRLACKAGSFGKNGGAGLFPHSAKIKSLKRGADNRPGQGTP
jgi:hypothetical protein